jgi:hypothetical protein
MKKELKNPNKADLDKDGVLTSYEKKRGMAIEKAMNASKGKFSSKPDVLDYMKKKGVKSMPLDEAVKKTQPPEFLRKQKNAPTKRRKSGALKKIAKRVLGPLGVLIPKQLGSAELKDIERKKYGGPVGVKMAKGGFKKKTPIY